MKNYDSNDVHDLFKQIKFDERYDSKEDNTTTLYFIAPKEVLKIVHKEFPEAVTAEISIEFPTDHSEARYADVCISPTDTEGEDYDWYDISIPNDEIEELISLANKEEKQVELS